MAGWGTTQEALFDAIEKEVKGIENWSVSSRPKMLRDLALAARYAAGGPQPGNVVVEK